MRRGRSKGDDSVHEERITCQSRQNSLPLRIRHHDVSRAIGGWLVATQPGCSKGDESLAFVLQRDHPFLPL
jgi:hypothetical protein